MQKRDIILCVIFTIITCGIYGLYWFVRITDEVNYLSEQNNASSGVLCLLLTIITCGIYGLYWAYKIGEKIDIAKNKHNILSSNTGILYLILELVFSLVGWILMQNEINKLIDLKQGS